MSEKKSKKILPVLLAVMMLAGSLNHIVSPEFYAVMIPEFISVSFANVLAAIVEGVIGIMLIMPASRKFGGLGFALLMIAFLPIHVWDVVRDDPVMGSLYGAFARLFIQFLLIYLGWAVYKQNKPDSSE